MKKRIEIISFLLAALLIVGCSSGPKVYDKSVPMEQSSTILIVMGTSVIEFDGKSTSLSWQAHSSFSNKEVIIPAGSHSLKLYTKRASADSMGSYITTHTSESITYEFLPGHTYVVAINNTGALATLTDKAVFLNEIIPDPTSTDASPFEGEWVNTKNEGTHFVFAKDVYAVKINGNYAYRGFVSRNGNNGTLSLRATYDAKKGEWVISMPIDQGRITYNGTSLIHGNNEYRRVR